MSTLETRLADSPDQTTEFELGRFDLFNFQGHQVYQYVFEPGWHWSQHVDPDALCPEGHLTYQVAGVLAVRMDDGSQVELQPGSFSAIPPGHDAWVVGDVAVVMIDWAPSAR